MLARRRIAHSLVWLLLVPTFAHSQSVGKKKVTSQADLPRFSYPITGRASELVQADDATFNAFAAKVRTDVDTVLRDYEIDDKATLRTLLSVKLDLQELAGEYQSGLQTVETLRALQEKPAAKLLAFLYPRARLQAAIDTKTTHGPAYEQALTKHFREAIDPLPWDVVQDTVKESYASSRLYTKSAAVGDVETELDPAVQKSGALDNQEAWQLIAARNDLQSWIPMLPARGQVLKAYIAAHKGWFNPISGLRAKLPLRRTRICPRCWLRSGTLGSTFLCSLLNFSQTQNPRPAGRTAWRLMTAETRLPHGCIRSLPNSRRLIRNSEN